MNEEVRKIIESSAGENLEEIYTSRDNIVTAYIKKGKIIDTVLTLREKHNFNFLVDLFGVDRRPYEEVLEVHYLLMRTKDVMRIRLKVKVSFDDAIVPSLTPFWRGADWFEREAYDMFGIVFKGHPDLRRILLWDGFDGYPLRKDFPLRGKLPVEKRYRKDDPKRKGWEA